MAARYCVQAQVSGRVQGVFFRKYTADKARSLNLAGRAENLPDGRVAVMAAGTKESVQVLLDWLHTGSPRAQVSSVDWQECEAPPTLGATFTTG